MYTNSPKKIEPVEPVILPEPTLRRLPWYLAYVENLLAHGQKHVSSTGISKALNVDSSQIAKDLSFLNLKGKTRIGYNVADLYGALSSFLGFREMHSACVFGAGSLGKALLSDTGLSNYGLHIVAAFDINPAKIGKYVENVPVYSPDEIDVVREKFNPTIAILTVPPDVAQSTADAAISAGFGAVWNFTPRRVKVPEGVAIANTSIYAHLALIFNRLKAKEQ